MKPTCLSAWGRERRSSGVDLCAAGVAMGQSTSFPPLVVCIFVSVEREKNRNGRCGTM